MKIPHALIPTRNDSSGHYYGASLSQIDILLLVTISLRIQGKINHQKMVAMFSQLRQGHVLFSFSGEASPLLRYVNTYHCKINDKWYNGESMYDILLDVYNEVCERKDIEMDVFLKYLNLYLNKNKNYCIDFVYFNLVEPLIKRFKYDNSLEKLRSFGCSEMDLNVVTYEEADSRGELSSGYCCRDCDGCLSEYKHSRYESYYGRNLEEKLSKLFKQQLLALKTESASRNKAERLKV